MNCIYSRMRKGRRAPESACVHVCMYVWKAGTFASFACGRRRQNCWSAFMPSMCIYMCTCWMVPWYCISFKASGCVCIVIWMAIREWMKTTLENKHRSDNFVSETLSNQCVCDTVCVCVCVWHCVCVCVRACSLVCARACVCVSLRNVLGSCSRPSKHFILWIPRPCSCHSALRGKDLQWSTFLLASGEYHALVKCVRRNKKPDVYNLFGTRMLWAGHNHFQHIIAHLFFLSNFSSSVVQEKCAHLGIFFQNHCMETCKKKAPPSNQRSVTVRN